MKHQYIILAAVCAMGVIAACGFIGPRIANAIDAVSTAINKESSL